MPTVLIHFDIDAGRGDAGLIIITYSTGVMRRGYAYCIRRAPANHDTVSGCLTPGRAARVDSDPDVVPTPLRSRIGLTALLDHLEYLIDT